MKRTLKLSSPLLLLLLFLFNPVKTWGQSFPPPPDCVVFVNLVIAAGGPATISVPGTAGGTTGFDNRTNGCLTWSFTYQATATSGTFTSISFQGANGAVVSGTFADWAGTIATGINPNTNQTNGTTTYTAGCASMVACTTPDSWVRILVTTNTFVGTLNGVLYGYRSGYPGSGGGSGGCPGTVATPCVVDGPTAAGSPPTTPPVLVAGQDGNNLQTIKTDTAGQPIPANASSADADTVSNTEATPTGAAAGILYPRVFNRVFNGTTWDRQRGDTTGVPPSNASSADADAVSNTQLTGTSVAAGGIIYPRVFNRVYNGTTWDRMPGNTTGIGQASTSINFGGDPASNTANTPSTVAGSRFLFGTVPNWWDGSSLRVARGNDTGMQLAFVNSNVTDGVGASLPGYSTTDKSQFIFFRDIPYPFNGTTYDRGRTASLANFPTATTLTARNSIGAPIAEKGSRWEVISNPAAGSQATASIALEAGVRHVADCVAFSAASTTAPALTALTINLRDGATGAGTIIRTYQVVISATTGQNVAPLDICGINLVGTTATAMTLEFSAGLTNLIESVSLSGYNVN